MTWFSSCSKCFFQYLSHGGGGGGGLLSAFFILERKTPPNMLKYQGKHEASLVIILNVGSAFGL